MTSKLRNLEDGFNAEKSGRKSLSFCVISNDDECNILGCIPKYPPKMR